MDTVGGPRSAENREPPTAVRASGQCGKRPYQAARSARPRWLRMMSA
jgi:hypothetical protein